MNLISIPANPVPEDVVTGMLKTPDGVSLRFARWAPPPGRKGTVCLFPGRAEFIEKYFETVRDLRTRGFAVAALDWRGQGGSQRQLRNPRKGYVRRFADYDVDLATELTKIITFQRAYQANARVITLTDQIMQETMNLRQ